jgi:hypothetical protein
VTRVKKVEYTVRKRDRSAPRSSPLNCGIATGDFCRGLARGQNRLLRTIGWK